MRANLDAPEEHKRGKGRYSRAFIFGVTSCAGRLARGSRFVTIVEMAPDEYVELDADSVCHGRDLGELWTGGKGMNAFGGLSASVQRVLPDGTLNGPIGGVISQPHPADWDEWPEAV